MEKVIIVVNAKVKLEGKLIASPVTEKMIQALSAAIRREPPERPIAIVTPATLRQGSEILEQPHVLLPITLQIPPFLLFPAHEIFLACQDISGLRAWVEHKLNLTAIAHEQGGSGNHWLPIVVSSDGLQFGHLIGEGAIPNAYQPTLDISHKQKKKLHNLAKKLLDSLSAPPAVYLLQVRLTSSQVLFDRLWPFPAAPAIASLNLSEPNLYQLHWQCVQTHRDVSTVS